MDLSWRTMLWQQFGAAIDMLENAIQACPDDLWDKSQSGHPYWYLAYHTLFFLDYYCSDTERGYVPPAPFTLSELDPAGVLPARVCTKGELLAYLHQGRANCIAAVDALTPESIGQRCGFKRIEVTVAELILYNMRHVQHHVAQMNLLLRQGGIPAPGWVSKAKR